MQVLCTVVAGWGVAGAVVWTGLDEWGGLGSSMATWPTKDNARGSVSVCEGLAWQLRADEGRLAVMQPRC